MSCHHEHQDGKKTLLTILRAGVSVLAIARIVALIFVSCILCESGGPSKKNGETAGVARSLNVAQLFACLSYLFSAGAG